MMKAAQRAADLPVLDDLPPIPTDVVDLVIDRIDAGYREGLLDLPAEAYAGLLCCLMPDEFEVPPVPPKPTATVPLTRDRERVYSARVRAAVALYHPGDARGDQADRGLKVRWASSRTLKVKGFSDETAGRRRK